MADTKVSDFTHTTTMTDDDTIPVIEDEDGTPANRQITWGNVKSNMPGAVLAVQLYEPVGDGNIGSSSSSTFADVDATNAAISFTVPASGKVLVEASALCRNDTAGGTVRLNLREGSSDLAGTDMRMTATSNSTTQDEPRGYFAAYVTGLTPGDAKTYKLGIARDGSTGTAQLRGGPGLGPLVIKVSAAP